jgi:integrase
VRSFLLAKLAEDSQQGIRATGVKRTRKRLSRGSVRQMYNHTPGHHPFFATLVLAGLRPGEGLAVTLDKIDFTNRTLLVDAQIGQHGGHKSTKTGEERKVDLSAILIDVLRAAAAPKTAGAKVVSINGSAVENSASTNSPWLFYPELGPTPSHRDAFRVYEAAIRAMRRDASMAFTVHVYGSRLPVRVPGAVDILAESLTGHRGHQMDTTGLLAEGGSL